MSTLKIPFGRSSGQLITECALTDLEWMLGRIEARLCSGEAYKFAEQDKRWAEEAARVLKARRDAGDTHAHGDAADQELARYASRPAPMTVDSAALLSKIVVGALREAKTASDALASARELGHLIAPAPSVGFVPEGCSVMVSAHLVDIERETYQHPGTSERGLGKVALDRIGSAAGIDWDPLLSRRIDDGSHPWYRACQAVGRVRQFDGTWRTLEDKKEIDLCDGSATIEGILAREAKKKRDDGTAYKGDGGYREIAMKRQHILSLCTTEARLRATRTLGIRTSYKPEELAKPFVVARLVFDGRSENPETARYFRERIADSFLGGTQALYGGAAVPQLRQAEPRVIDLPAEPEEFGPPDYGFADPPQKTGTGGPF